MYEGLKQVHLITIGLSVLLFCIRYVLMMMDSPRLGHVFLKSVPHINDAAMLISGIVLIMITRFIPFTVETLWLTEKLTCVLAYIALSFFALKLGRNKLLRTFAFFGALGWLGMAGKIAISKSPIF